MTPSELITSYIRIRDRKREMETAHKEALKPFNQTLAQIEIALAKVMDDTGLENLPGGDGTAYRAVRSSVVVSDWDAFMGWVKETGAWHLLEHRAAKTAVEEVLAETNELPPGISLSREVAVQIRKN
jgi:hypothetical protein